MRRAACVVLVGFVLVFGIAMTSGPLRAESWSIIALGDMPYDKAPHTPYRRLLSAVAASNAELVIHVGDTKAARLPCTVGWHDWVLAGLNAIGKPVLYTPGDNEWTDCRPRDSMGLAPSASLAYLRGAYFPTDRTLGRGMPLRSQRADGYPENRLMAHRGIVIVALHVVGTFNNGGRNGDSAAEVEEMLRERAAREAATLRWLHAAFDEAERTAASGIVVALHANAWCVMRNDHEKWRAAFGETVKALAERTLRFGRPVIALHGDTHHYDVSNPFSEAAWPGRFNRFERVEVFGARNHHAVRIVVDASVHRFFRIEPFIVADNPPPKPTNRNFCTLPKPPVANQR